MTEHHDCCHCKDDKHTINTKTSSPRSKFKRNANIVLTILLAGGLVLFFVSDTFKHFVIDTLMSAEKLFQDKITQLFMEQAEQVSNNWINDLPSDARQSSGVAP